MMREIFDLLNQVETDLGEYEILEPSQSEKEESTARILCKLKERDVQNNPGANLKSAQFMDLKKLAGAAALFLICLLSVGGVAYAMTDGFRALFTFISGGAIYETTESSIMGSTGVTAVTMQSEWGIPLLLQDGRLYFTGDGGKTDITDFVSETEPYFIDVVDEEGNTHRFIVGGSPEEGYYGYIEMIIDTEGVLRGGTGNWTSKSGDRPEWLIKGENAVYSEVYGTSVDLWTKQESQEQERILQEQRRSELAMTLNERLSVGGSKEDKEVFVEWLLDTYEPGVLETMDLSEDIDRQFYYATGKSLHVLWDTSLGYLEDDDTAAAHSIYLRGEEDSVVDLVFAGDICLTEDGYVIDHYDEVGGDINLCLSEELMDRLNEADISMINHEYPVSVRGTPLEGKYYTFRADPDREIILQQMGIDIVSLANNHIYDFGADAFYDTLEILKEIKMPYVGAGADIEEASRPVYFVADGVKIGFVAANRSEKFIFTPEAGEESPGVVRMYDTAMMNDIIKEASGQCDYLIAYVHWGTEDSKYYESYQTAIAQEFFDAGADAIIGSHPHVLQGIGYVDGKPVVYSLGDFWFNSETKYTTIVTLKVTIDGLEELSVLPCIQEGYETHYIGDESGQSAFHNYLRELSPETMIDDSGVVVESK